MDGVGVVGSLAELYPDTPPEAWEPYRETYPELFSADSWRVPCTCFLLRGEQTVLVDTGVGPPGSWPWELESEGGLLPALAEHGVKPEDVDVVLITHPHFDHHGWNTDAEGNIVFPRARYLLHEDGLAAAREQADRRHIQRCLLGIEERLETFDADGEVAPGVETVFLPGHERGHVGVRSGETFIISDAAPHPALLDHPEWRFVYDLDHDAAVETRRRIAPLRKELTFLCGHWPDGGRLR